MRLFSSSSVTEPNGSTGILTVEASSCITFKSSFFPIVPSVLIKMRSTIADALTFNLSVGFPGPCGRVNPLPLQPPARVLTATALLVAAVVAASVTALCRFVVVGDGCVGCYHLNLLRLLAQRKLLAELHADRGTKHPIKAVGSQVALLGTGADGNAWVSRVGCPAGHSSGCTPEPCT